MTLDEQKAAGAALMRLKAAHDDKMLRQAAMARPEAKPKLIKRKLDLRSYLGVTELRTYGKVGPGPAHRESTSVLILGLDDQADYPSEKTQEAA